MRLVTIIGNWKWMLAALSLGALPIALAAFSIALPDIPLCVPEKCGPDDDAKAWFIAIATVFVAPFVLLIASECLLIHFYVKHLNKRFGALGAKNLTAIEVLAAGFMMVSLSFIGLVLSIVLTGYIPILITGLQNTFLTVG